MLIFDTIRNVACDMKAEDVIYDETRRYNDFDELYVDACLIDVLNGLVGRKVKAADLKKHGVKTYFSLPPYVNSTNLSDNTVKSTRKFGTQNVDQTERGDEVELSPERLLKIMKSDNGYNELKRIASSLGLDTKGGKKQILNRLLNSSSKVYSEISKHFTRITGKNGGVLHGQCEHGITYCLKYLTLPEGVSDYT